jgi:hypothetical protein
MTDELRLSSWGSGNSNEADILWDFGVVKRCRGISSRTRTYASSRLGYSVYSARRVDGPLLLCPIRLRHLLQLLRLYF